MVQESSANNILQAAHLRSHG